MNYSILKARLEDRLEWALMRQQLWPLTLEMHQKEISSFLEDEGNIAFIVKKGDQTTIAFLEASIRKYANGCRDTPVVFIEGIWVVESERRNGIAPLLIDKLEAWAKDHNFFEICSDCCIENETSILAHKKWGFEETERVVYFRKSIR